MMAISLLTLRILSPNGVTFEKVNLSAINISLANNHSIGIRPGHAPLIAETKRGAVTYRISDEEDQIYVHPGVMEIRDNLVTILTAGEVSETQYGVRDEKDKEYNRLMQALIQQINPD